MALSGINWRGSSKSCEGLMFQLRGVIGQWVRSGGGEAPFWRQGEGVRMRGFQRGNRGKVNKQNNQLKKEITGNDYFLLGKEG